MALCYNGPNTLTCSVTGGVQVQSRIPARNPGYRLGSLRPRDDSGDTRHWAACIAGAQSTGVTRLGSAPPQKGRPAFPGSWRCSELRPALCQPRSSEPGAPRSVSPGDPASILPPPLTHIMGLKPKAPASPKSFWDSPRGLFSVFMNTGVEHREFEISPHWTCFFVSLCTCHLCLSSNITSKERPSPFHVQSPHCILFPL